MDVVYVLYSGTIATSEDDDGYGFTDDLELANVITDQNNKTAAADQCFWYETINRITTA
jgi:hypothetical protein